MLCLLLIVLAAPVSYELDPAKTQLIAITHPGGFKAASHPHVVEATAVKGSLTWDPENVEGSSVKVSFPSDGLKADDPASREREGMGTMGDSAREAVNANLREEDQLDVKRYPTISFESTRVDKVGEGKLAITGLMTIREVKHAYTFGASVSLKDKQLTAEGQFTLYHSDFKIRPYSAALGAVKNQDEITLKVKLVGKAP